MGGIPKFFLLTFWRTFALLDSLHKLLDPRMLECFRRRISHLAHILCNTILAIWVTQQALCTTRIRILPGSKTKPWTSFSLFSTTDG